MKKSIIVQRRDVSTFEPRISFLFLLQVMATATVEASKVAPIIMEVMEASDCGITDALAVN